MIEMPSLDLPKLGTFGMPASPNNRVSQPRDFPVEIIVLAGEARKFQAHEDCRSPLTALFATLNYP
jgi:hypothetical protein